MTKDSSEHPDLAASFESGQTDNFTSPQFDLIWDSRRQERAINLYSHRGMVR